MQRVILPNLISTVVHVMMALLEMGCFVKVSVKPSPIRLYGIYISAIDPCQLNNGDCGENESSIFEEPGLVSTLEYFTVIIVCLMFSPVVHVMRDMRIHQSVVHPLIDVMMAPLTALLWLIVLT